MERRHVLLACSLARDCRDNMLEMICYSKYLKEKEGDDKNVCSYVDDASRIFLETSFYEERVLARTDFWIWFCRISKYRKVIFLIVPYFSCESLLFIIFSF